MSYCPTLQQYLARLANNRRISHVSKPVRAGSFVSVCAHHFTRLRVLPFIVGFAVLLSGSSGSQSQSSGSASAPPELVIQTGHSSRVNCAVFAPDRRWLASGSADNSIRLWDVASGSELRALIGHNNWIKSLAISRNADMLASGSNDRTVKLWDVSSGRERFTLSGHGGPIEVVVFSPDDRLIASGSTDATIKIWERTTGREVQTLRGHVGGVTSLAFSPDGKFLASGGADKSIRFWDTTTWTSARTLNKHTAKINDLVFSPGGQRLASGSADGTILVWDTASGRDRVAMKRGTSALLDLAFVSEAELVSTSADGSIVTWDVTSGKEKRAASGDAEVEEVLFASISNDGSLVASSLGTKSVNLRDSATGSLLRRLESHSVGFYSVAFSGDGRWLASGANDRTVRLWQIATGRELPKLAGHSGWITAIAFSPDSRLLASGSNSGEVKLWDVNTGRETLSLPHAQDRIHTIAFSPDGKWLAAAGTEKTIHLLNVASKQSTKLLGHAGEITSLAFLPDSSLIASGSTDKTVRFWKPGDGSVLRTLDTIGDQVNAIAFSPDGKTLAAGTADKRILLYPMDSTQPRILNGHGGEILTLAFSGDGRSLASGGIDEVVRIWDPQTGSVRHELKGASGTINSVAFSNDSQWIVSGNGDGSMIVWNAGTGSVAANMVSLPGRDDWLVATPAGLFDGSHAAWKFLLWRFAQSTFKVAPVESFFNEFYYPGLLADIFAGKNPQAKADILKKDRRQPQINIATAEPYAPKDKVARRTVRLKVEVIEAGPGEEYKNGSGARDLRLFRNGLLVKTWKGDVLAGRQRDIIETEVPIIAGENNFTAYAFNRDNVKSTDSQITVTGAEALRRTGTAYLLVAGVGNYANPQYNLNYSVADATAIGDQLKNQQEVLGRYQPIEVIPLLNEEATKANILLALRLLAGTSQGPLPKEAPASLAKIRPAQPEDAVVFYFSGHGTAEQDRFYLLPHDIGYQGPRSKLSKEGLATILSHSISDLELEDALKPVDADQLLLIIDACNSGQALKAEEERRGPMNTKGLAQLAYEKGMYVLTASQSDEVAFESAGLKHSYLAYALVEEGIKSGAADGDRNGQVFLKEWFDYATERVPRIGKEKPRAGKQLEEVDPDEQRVQRPRVFNMRQGGAERFVIARLAGAGL
ncbi:MAG TPA: caspase family protein [Pyrinomonadaceae bacterium]|nr:caspase family protein [Pyrinomonadaceae bacterium]